ncbi:tetraacyldisaccharide 4'-kinase [Pseudoxanthomonas sp. SGD-10]|nr:tetraacyldisaccharide 4'-kinase [Pseudoxanthomonas sp. SGD-10]
MKFCRLLLFPFSIIYGIVVWLRNRFYDLGWLKSTKFDFPVIVVGNLEVGGSGKTPITEYLVKLLSIYKVTVLSRGYGRKTKGFRWVSATDESSLAGDEPLQIKKKFPKIKVAVCEKRVEGLQKIKEEIDEAVAVLDDAYQHRALTPGFSILVFDYNRLKEPRLLLPAGNYRDGFSERKRADLVLISKCPQMLTHGERVQISKKLLTGQQKIVFASIVYSNRLVGVFDDSQYILPEDIGSDTEVILLTGIAKPELLFNHLEQYTKRIRHHNYPDHHPFNKKNILKLVEDYESIKTTNKVIITTEKDAVRLTTSGYEKHLAKLRVFKWPIQIAFNQTDKDIFDQEILNYVKRTNRVN